MNTQVDNEPIKENRGDFKSELARLQTIILNSTKRPVLPLTLILETLFLVQIFGAPFNYLNSLMVNPQWGYLPILSYLVPAYYWVSLNGNGFLAMLVLVNLMMILYLAGIALLIFLPQQNKVSKILARVVKIKLEVYSTVLYSSIAKTVISLLNCQSVNVSTADNPTTFVCMSQCPQWLRMASPAIFALFAMVILLQSYLKFEFYTLKGRSSVLKRSQQWIPFLMAMHVVVEIIATIAPPTVLLLSMNFVSILMIVSLVFLDQARTQISTKLNVGISICLLYLMLIIDLNYLFQFPVPFVLWFLVTPCIITMSVCYDKLSIKSQLHNINKWNSATDRLEYCCGLRTLLSAKRTTYVRALLEGYTDIHFNKCDMSSCPFRLTKTGLDRIRVFRQDKTLTDSEIKFQELIIKIYSEGIKFFPLNPALNIELAIFLYEHNMKERALNYLLTCSLQNANLEQYYKFYRLRNVLHNDLISKRESTLDLLTEMQMRDLEEEFLRYVQKASLSDLELWSVLLEEHPDFGKLDKVGVERIKLGEKVNQLYEKIAEMGNSQRVTALYVEYLINVCKVSGNFSDVQQKTKKLFKLDERITIFDWANSSYPSFIISGEEKSYGEIQDLNLSGASLLGYEKSELLNRKLSFIMPELLSPFAQQIVSFNDDNKEFYLLRKDKYSIRVSRKLYISSSILRGSIFICTVEPFEINPLSCVILVSRESPFNVVGIEAKCVSFFGIEAKTSEEPHPVAEISEWLNDFLEGDHGNLAQNISLGTLLSPNIIRRNKPQPEELQQEFSIKVSPTFQGFLKVEFLKKKSPIVARHQKSVTSNFRFQPVVVDSRLVYCNNLTTNYQYLSSNIVLEEEDINNQSCESSEYGKGIRIVRLQDNQVQVIEESVDSQSSQENMNVAQTDTALIERTRNFKHKGILQTRESLRQFVDHHDSGSKIQGILTISTAINIIMFLVVSLVFRSHQASIDSNLKDYVDQNTKIGEIEYLAVLVTRTALMQQNKSLASPDQVRQQIVQSLGYLQSLKNLGKSTTVQIVLMDNSTQLLSSVQFIDALNSNLLQFVKALTNMSTLYSTVLPLFFCIQNNGAVYTQLVNNLKNHNDYIKQFLNQSVLIETVILVLFLVWQTGFVAFIFNKMYLMFNQKIQVLKVFLEISEQNVRIMSIKTEQFLNTLYNNDTDIDDEETIVRKTNNKHTFAIKKKFKLIKRGKAAYLVFGILPAILVSLLLVSYVVSSDNLIFTKNKLSFLNTTSGGKGYFYSNLQSIQMNVYNGSQNPTPAFQYVAYYKSMMDTYYDSFSAILEFTSYWVNLMMDNICSGSVIIQYACLSPSSTKGGMALITELVLTTTNPGYTKDFTDYYYNLYRIFGGMHFDLGNHAYKIFQSEVTQTEKVLIIILVLGIVMTPILLMVVGMRVIQSHSLKIQQTRMMVGLLPVEHLKNSEALRVYIEDTVSRRKWKCL